MAFVFSTPQERNSTACIPPISTNLRFPSCSKAPFGAMSRLSPEPYRIKKKVMGRWRKFQTCRRGEAGPSLFEVVLYHML